MPQKRWLAILLLLGGLTAGCDGLSFIINPTTVRISLVNTTGFAVEGSIRISDVQEIPRALLEEIGDEIEFNVPDGQVVTLVEKCDDLQAMVVEQANMVGTIGPDADTDVLRDGDDFGCGDRIILTFTQSILIDFDITVRVE